MSQVRVLLSEFDKILNYVIIRNIIIKKTWIIILFVIIIILLNGCSSRTIPWDNNDIEKFKNDNIEYVPLLRKDIE
ncbi:MAG: hypothetical protein ACOCRK_02540 [bacterium]